MKEFTGTMSEDYYDRLLDEHLAEEETDEIKIETLNHLYRILDVRLEDVRNAKRNSIKHDTKCD